MLTRLAAAALVAAALILPAAAPTPVLAARKAPCADISRTACVLRGAYRFTGADGARFALAGNLTVKQAKTKLQLGGLLRFTQEGGTAPAAGTTVTFAVVYMTNRVACAPGEGGVSRTLLTSAPVIFKVEDTLLDTDATADEYSYKANPRKSTRTVSSIAADLRAAGAKTGEIVLLLDGGTSCAVLATR